MLRVLWEQIREGFGRIVLARFRRRLENTSQRAHTTRPPIAFAPPLLFFSLSSLSYFSSRDLPHELIHPVDEVEAAFFGRAGVRYGLPLRTTGQKDQFPC